MPCIILVLKKKCIVCSLPDSWIVLYWVLSLFFIRFVVHPLLDSWFVLHYIRGLFCTRFTSAVRISLAKFLWLRSFFFSIFFNDNYTKKSPWPFLSWNSKRWAKENAAVKSMRQFKYGTIFQRSNFWKDAWVMLSSQKKNCCIIVHKTIYFSVFPFWSLWTVDCPFLGRSNCCSGN